MSAFWPCPICETSNPAGVALCGVCGTDRPLAAGVISGARAVPRSPGLPVASSPRVVPLPPSGPRASPRAPLASARTSPTVSPAFVERGTTSAAPTWALDQATLRLRVMRALSALGLALRRLLRG
jgi:hypothetical protein